MREEDHGQTLAAPLGLPEYAAPAVPLPAGLQRCGDRIVHSEKLMVLTEDLDGPGFLLGEQREVFNQVEQASVVARATNHRLQTDDAFFALIINFLPFSEVVERVS